MTDFIHTNGSFQINGISRFTALKVGDTYPLVLRGGLLNSEDFYQLVMTENGGNFGKQVSGQWVNLWNIATKSDLNSIISTSSPSYSTDVGNAPIMHNGAIINSSNSGYYFVVARAKNTLSDWCCALIRTTSIESNRNVDIIGKGEHGVIEFSSTTGNLLYRTDMTPSNISVLTIKMA